MSLRRFYTRIENEETIQYYFFVLNLFTFTLTDDHDCLVCLDKIKNNDYVICHECKKALHLTCLEGWFNINNERKCPHCRSKWKFEIDIIEKPHKIMIELDNYSVIPNYKNDYIVENNRITIRGSITGPININNRFGY
jgi:hypothetical protein